jgi:tetratricopeptide (TPR) repeat protein
VRRKIIACCTILIALAAGAAAQGLITVRGQILLPNGSQPTENIRFLLESGDGSLRDWRFTDSNGRFILERLSPIINYTITVESDGSTYDRTIYTFSPQFDSIPRITLRPLSPQGPADHGPVAPKASAGYRADPKSVEAHEAALAEIRKKKYDKAEELLRKAVGADPKYALPLIDLGALFIQQKKYAEAEKALRQAVEVDSKSTHALLNLGIALNRQDKFADAIPVLREALRLAPGLTAARLHLGLALVETEQFKEAEPELLHVVKAGGAEEVLGQLYLGQLYARTSQYEKSIAAFELYLQKAPNAANAADVRSLIERMRKELAPRS